YLARLSHHPPVVVAPDTPVLSAVELMSKNRVGAVGVVENDELVGIFTERDLMERVVLKTRPPASTRVADVMTSPVTSVRADDDPAQALETMMHRHIRHLPVTDHSNRILGVLSIRNLLQHQLEKARSEADSLEAYFGADGAGG
ncbi:MAG TPA: CBS domain-containing protein, partial [Thermoanaerobaculia bacterium]|nr:CBS domain-containing protein [Thermoanaerobaculia bacterium]